MSRFILGITALILFALWHILITMWTKIIDEIREGGLRDPEIARLMSVNQSTINRLRHGKLTDPPYSLGRRLLKLRQQTARRLARKNNGEPK